MRRTIRCPNPACGREYVAADGDVGRLVTCKSCGNSFAATASPPSESDTTSEALPPPAPPHGVDRKEPALSTLKSPPVEPVRSAPTPVPAEFGRFRLRGQLGAGSFGTVYRAYDPAVSGTLSLPTMWIVPTRGSRRGVGWYVGVVATATGCAASVGTG